MPDAVDPRRRRVELTPDHARERLLQDAQSTLDVSFLEEQDETPSRVDSREPQARPPSATTAAGNQVAPTERRHSPDVPKVPCKHCGSWESRVKDGRPVADGYRRKRVCKTCGQPFFTIERAA